MDGVEYYGIQIEWMKTSALLIYSFPPVRTENTPLCTTWREITNTGMIEVIVRALLWTSQYLHLEAPPETGTHYFLSGRGGTWGRGLRPLPSQAETKPPYLKSKVQHCYYTSILQYCYYTSIIQYCYYISILQYCYYSSMLQFSYYSSILVVL